MTYEPPKNSSSPGSIEVSSDLGIKSLGLDHTEKQITSADLEVSEALQRLEEQLSLNEDTFKDFYPFNSQDGDANDLEILEYEKEIFKKEPVHRPDFIRQDGITGLAGTEKDLKNLVLPSERDGSEESLYWKNVLDKSRDSLSLESQNKLHASARTEPPKQHDLSYWSSFNVSNIEDSFMFQPQDVGSVQIPPHSSAIQTLETDCDYYPVLLNQGLIGSPLSADSNLTIAEKQKFRIREISPGWGYSAEPTKVIIVGSYVIHQNQCGLACLEKLKFLLRFFRKVSSVVRLLTIPGRSISAFLAAIVSPVVK